VPVTNDVAKPAVSKDGGIGSESDAAGPELPAVERVVLHRLRERGVTVDIGDVRREIDRARARFREARVHQFVPIFVIRDTCASFEHLRARDRA